MPMKTVTDLSFFGFVQGNVVSTLVTLDCFTNNMISMGRKSLIRTGISSDMAV